MWAARVRSRNEAPDLEEQQGPEIGKGVNVMGDYWQLFLLRQRERLQQYRAKAEKRQFATQARSARLYYCISSDQQGERQITRLDEEEEG